MSHGGGKPRTAEAAATVPRAACVGGLHPPYKGSAVRATLALTISGLFFDSSKLFRLFVYFHLNQMQFL